MANRKNIKKVIKLMKWDKTVKFDMGTLMSTPDRVTSNKTDCNTACCLAGFAFIAKKGRPWKKNEDVRDIEKVATEFLDLTREEAENLFYPGSMIYDEAKRKHGIQVLRHLIDTGEVDWNITGLRD